MSQQVHYSDLSIIIPTLNEAGNIRELITELLELYPQVKILVVDDGSRDGTIELVSNLSRTNPQVDLLDRTTAEVKGITAAVLAGIDHVSTKYFQVIDGDRQHPPALIKDLYAKLLTGNQLVSGARLPYKENQGLHRILITKVATSLARAVLSLKLGRRVQDPMSGFFAGERIFVKRLIENNTAAFVPQGYKILFDLLKLNNRQFAFSEIPYQFLFRSNGQSKLRPKHAFLFLKSILKTPLS